MKTTSYEISKKLKEAGFEAETDYYWVKCEEGIICVNAYVFSDYMSEGEKLCESFDLETILDALPDPITREYKSKEDGEVKEFREKLIIEKNEICYSCDDIENADDANRYFQEYGYMQDISVFKKFDAKSLADTAGRMWLELKKKNLL